MHFLAIVLALTFFFAPGTIGAQTEDCVSSASLKDIRPKTLYVEYDEAYAASLKADRGFAPTLPFSPFDTLRVSFELDVCTKNKEFREPFFLVTTSARGEEVKLRQLPPFKLGKQLPDGAYEYAVTLQGWPSGIVSGKQMDALIESIAYNRPISIRIANAAGEREEVELPLSACLRLGGKGEKKIIGMRAKDTLSPVGLTQHVLMFRKEGIEKQQPFERYSSAFSYYVDLVPRDDSRLLEGLKKKRPTSVGELSTSPACGEGSVFVLWSGLSGTNVTSVVSPGARLLVLKPSARSDEAMADLRTLFSGFSDRSFPIREITVKERMHQAACSGSSLSILGQDPACVLRASKETAVFAASDTVETRVYWYPFSVLECAYAARALTGKTAESHIDACSVLEKK